jgi:hypothetical protein
VKRVLAAVVLALALPAPASAFSPPELFIKLQPWTTHEATTDWIPLANAPAVDYIGGYQIGYRLQPSDAEYGRQQVAMTINAVPDGAVTQPDNDVPYCSTKAGTPGTIVDVAPELQYEGNGTYTITVSIGPDGGDRDDCLTGPSTTASYSVTTMVTPRVEGTPVSFRARPASSFAGIAADDPPGGYAQVGCAFGDVATPTGLVVPADDDGGPRERMADPAFTRPGRWSCFARGVADTRDAAYDTVYLGTPWSPPLPVDVRSDFRRRSGRFAHPRARRPTITFKAEWPAESAGGKARLKLYRFAGCGYKKAGTFRGRFTAKGLKLRIRRPKLADFYVGVLRFGGSRLIRKSDDPRLVDLIVKKRKIGFVRAVPQCG